MVNIIKGTQQVVISVFLKVGWLLAFCCFVLVVVVFKSHSVAKAGLEL